MAQSPQNQTETSKSRESGGTDAVDLLIKDHRAVSDLFARFERSTDDNEKSALAERICLMLRVHTRIEEEIFYPEVEKAVERELVAEARVEHEAAKELMEKIESAEVGDELFEAEVKVLREQVEHHVEEEESELFPQVREADLDLEAMGERMAKRKAELMREAGDESVADEPKTFH